MPSTEPLRWSLAWWAELVSIFGPTITALAAIGALIVGILTIRQRTEADRREHWWKRAQWALELTMKDDAEQQDLGLRTLAYLGTSELTGKDEADFLDAATLAPLADDENELAIEEYDNADEN